MRITTTMAAIFLVTTPAYAHKKWANGDPIPAWVSAACCGPADAHQLTSDQVSETSDGYDVIDGGHKFHIKTERVLPSQDGEYWIFYSNIQTDPTVYCFFLPISG